MSCAGGKVWTGLAKTGLACLGTRFKPKGGLGWSGSPSSEIWPNPFTAGFLNTNTLVHTLNNDKLEITFSDYV